MGSVWRQGRMRPRRPAKYFGPLPDRFQSAGLVSRGVQRRGATEPSPAAVTGSAKTRAISGLLRRA